MGINWIKVAKIGGTALSVAGMILGTWADGKTNTSTLVKLFNEHVSKKSK